MSVRDVIKKSILESDMYSQAISGSVIVTIIVDMAIALLVGILIYMIYKKLYQGVVYSRNYAITLVGMTVLTCMVTLAISTNIVISLGMVGALSIVRYRTAIKEPLDLLYLFWAITSGITIGASMYILVAIGFVFMLAMLVIMSKNRDTDEIFVMIVHCADEKVYENVIREIGRIKHQVRSKLLRNDIMEVTIELRPKKRQAGYDSRIKALEGVSDVTLLQYNGEYHG